jgi:non-heme chloroperoxidase
MTYINVGQENSGNIDLYYEDHGSGKPVVLIHGFPLSGASWEKQVTPLLAAGRRVITYDRRGFGKSSQPTTGYDYDTFAADLNKLIQKLDLREAALVGFSMGGGEVARYLGAFGSERISKAVILSGIPPYLLKGPDNPIGADGGVFKQIQAAIVADRFAYLTAFFKDFYNVDVLGGTRISEQALQASFNVAAGASPIGTFACVPTWGTDFRKDLQRITIPTLVMHGDADRILPIAATGKRTHESIKGSQYVVIEGGPHCITWTHADKVNPVLVEFLK